MAGTVSKREQIMENLMARFLARQAGIQDNLYTWNLVVRKPISRAQIGVGNVIGLFDIREVKKPEMGFMLCELTVVVEFYAVLMIGDDASTELNKMLLDIQRTIRADIYCSGLSLNIVESKNELDIDGPTSSIVAGVVEYSVLYRHLVNDPAA